MKPVIVGALLLLFGVAFPAFAQEEHHEEGAKHEEKHEEAKPEGKREEAKPPKHEEAKPEAKHEQEAHERQAERQYARNGQKDSRGHEYNERKFGRDHHIRFEATGGRMFHGRREYSFGGYWFYARAYPPWFYQQDVYFIMGADGLWYAVAYGNPSLTFQVNIE